MSLEPATRFIPDLTFNPQATVSVRHIGDEGLPVLVIDNVLNFPEQLVELARHVPFGRPRGMYPGLNAMLPPPYLRAVMGWLRPYMAQVFAIAPTVQVTAHGFFALATLTPDRLHPMQKIPHQDAANPDRLGMVHYLCRGAQGGTGFYRHRTTGFESVDAARREIFAPVVVEEALRREAAGENDRAMPDYEMTGSVEAVFNRLIVYRAHMLHAGLLTESTLSDDPLTGRLTANIFAGEGPPE